MITYIVAIVMSLLIMGLLISDRENFINRGMSERFYYIFTATLACFIICCFISWTVAVCLFVPFSLAAPVLCLNRFKGEVLQPKIFSYILAGISIVSLGKCVYNLVNCLNHYPDYKFSFLWLLLFLFSTAAFYFVSCRKQLSYMKKTEEELAMSKSKKNHGSSVYVLPFFIVTFISAIFFESNLRDICKEKIYEKGKVYVCAEITDVVLSTSYGRKGRSYLEYTVATDYIEPETETRYVFSERGERGSVDGLYSYRANPEKFHNSPYIPKGKIIIERAYFDNRVFSVVNKHPSAKQIVDFQRPIVEIDSNTYYLDSYADIEFLKNNLDFYYQYCGIKLVVKAVKIGEEDDKIIYENPLLDDKIYFKPETENNPDTLLFYKTIYKNESSDSESDSDWICIKKANQTPENLSKISDYGYYFNDKIWSKEEFESQIPKFKLPNQF